eukprot:TRINITY_DN3655_c1_g1_i1.p1 TRINITY_DN3655_c1_g1~~TRINITY_DN3655_c1_g1_i1.p1  ORF type:complete len:475 (-),score=75.57 TRINITY_DN3655_c1_g1_i1:157-1557(-)
MLPFMAHPSASSKLFQVDARRTHLLPLFVLFRSVGGSISMMTSEAQSARTSARYTIFGEAPLEARLPPITERQTTKQAMQLFSFWKGERAAKDRGHSVLADGTKAPKYLTFDTDVGGMNNMRMLFEYAVHLVSTTGRTLVLPPKEGWYLVDWGALNTHDKADMRWINQSKSVWSSYQEFWDIDDLRKYINVAPATSFFLREHERFTIPDAVDPGKVPPTNSPDPSAWKDWLFQNANRSAGCDAAMSLAHGDHALVHLPMKPKTSDKDSTEYRYFDCKPRDRGELLVHFHPRYFNMVSKLLGGEGKVKDLKFGSYAAIHLRRNDFQYTQAPSAEGSKAILSEVSKYISPGDAVYIASDETNDSWWDGFRTALDTQHYRLISLKDFQEDLERMGATRRHLGVLEMVLCAGAKIFFGTPLSTFTTGIHQIRESIYNSQKNQHRNAEVGMAEEHTNSAPMYHGQKLFVHL